MPFLLKPTARKAHYAGTMPCAPASPTKHIEQALPLLWSQDFSFSQKVFDHELLNLSLTGEDFFLFRHNCFAIWFCGRQEIDQLGPLLVHGLANLLGTPLKLHELRFYLSLLFFCHPQLPVQRV
jgi:hypothetical protein